MTDESAEFLQEFAEHRGGFGHLTWLDGMHSPIEG